MLVITRREGEEVIIGDPAAPLGIVRIASIKGDRVRLAFEFPREIRVDRREVSEQINAANKEANPIAGQIRPAAGGCTPASTCNNVLLPLPLQPSTAHNSPAATSRSNPLHRLRAPTEIPIAVARSIRPAATIKIT
jgi:carbon storage regulator